MEVGGRYIHTHKPHTYPLSRCVCPTTHSSVLAECGTFHPLSLDFLVSQLTTVPSKSCLQPRLHFPLATCPTAFWIPPPG